MSLNLPFISQKKDQETSEVSENSFLCLVFTENGVRAAFWQVDDGEVDLKETSSLHSFTNDDEAIISTDAALKELGKESESTNEVVFGFDPKWVNDSGLIKEKKPFIKKLTENLSLKPVGFVVLTDALIQDVLSREKNISQILVYIQETALSLILLKKGKISQQISVGKSEEVVSDIIEGLARFSKEKGDDGEGYLPAKMVISSLVLSNQDLQDIRSSIIGYDWADKHPFVQSPLIEQFHANQVLETIVKQGGLAVAEARGLSLAKESEEEIENAVENTANPEDFGFSSVDPDMPGDNFSSPNNEEKTEATSFGVPISQQELPRERSRKFPKEETKEEHKTKNPLFKRKESGPMNKITNWYKNNPHKNMILGGIVGGAIASVGLFIGWLNFSYKVEVTLQLAEKVITKDVELLVDTTIATSNVEDLSLRGELEEEEFSGTKVVDTTGVKLVGEKAKGKITILNKTTSQKTFSAGAIFTAGTLNFSLDEEATIASASVTQSGTSETKDYGKLETTVTAIKIGADSNLNKETSLSVGSYDTGTYSAVVVDTFTGGSSREIRVISDEDKASVLSELKQELFDKAKESFSEKSSNGLHYVLSGKQTVLEADYGGAVGEEADQLALELSLTIEAIRYSSDDIKPLVAEILKEELPDNYEFADEDPQILTSPREEASSSAQIILDANISAKALPIFDKNNLLPVLKGLPLEAVTGKATERPEVKSASYRVRPSLAKTFNSTMPKADNRIIIEIEESGN